MARLIIHRHPIIPTATESRVSLSSPTSESMHSLEEMALFFSCHGSFSELFLPFSLSHSAPSPFSILSALLTIKRL